MPNLTPKPNKQHLVAGSDLQLPALIRSAGKRTITRYIEFFAAHIRNKNTRAAYVTAVSRFFDWCDDNGIESLIDIEPLHVAAYIELMTNSDASPQTVKQHLAGIKSMFDWLVLGSEIAGNPASIVRGPKSSSKKGKTPILSAEEVRTLMESIPTDTISGLRDRALIATMTYSFARVSAALGMNVKDVYTTKHRLWLRLYEKGGKRHEVPAHHKLEEYLREYIEAADLKRGPLFRTLKGKSNVLNNTRLQRRECLAMVKRRVANAGLDSNLSNHSFRGTGITAYLDHPDAKLEHAQDLANHADPKTTRLYDRRSDQLSLDEIEKINI